MRSGDYKIQLNKCSVSRDPISGGWAKKNAAESRNEKHKDEVSLSKKDFA